jgi:hypothetical protein
MRKIYIAPSIEIVQLEMQQQIMTTSTLTLNRMGTDAEVLTNKRGAWSSESWSTLHEE